ncbi:hypothetical protein [Vibrio hepatarius]|uniref:hypothetical protein n=1 Tax=Vibrio hepatarius TaxID=171383 RepID=UPI001C085E1C|nr:hypothetical protein [Vibrio hepatarius]MBU2896103.1 hypothetical protein [Vibrio hepatarius]
MIQFSSNTSVTSDLIKDGVAITSFDSLCLSELIDAVGDLPSQTASQIYSGAFIPEYSPVSEYAKYYFNEDNPAKTDFSITSPLGDKVSVGAIYFLFNTSTIEVNALSLVGKDIYVPCGKVLFVNIGLIGLNVDFTNNDSNGLLQGVIHSELDGLSFFENNNRPLKVTNRYCSSTSKNSGLGEFDFEKFCLKGYSESRVSSEIVDSLLSLVKGEHFLGVEQSELDSYKGYSKRFISKHSMYRPTKIKDSYIKLVRTLKESFKQTLDSYPNPKGDNLSVFFAPRSHYMDLHADCSDGSPIISMIYLSDDEFLDCDGGQVSLNTVLPNPVSGSMEKDTCEAVFNPSHGLIVHINNSNIRFAHQVHEVLSDKFRYSVIVNLSMLTNPDWDYEFNEVAGKFEEGVVVLGEPSLQN